MDGALSAWTEAFSQQYREGQQAQERLPSIYSTFANLGGAVGGAALSLDVAMLGGEQAHVFGIFDFSVSAGVVASTGGASQAELAEGKLRILYPGGGETTFGSAQRAALRVSNQMTKSSAVGAVRSTVATRASVCFPWPIEVRARSGGTHTFQLRSTGSGIINSAQLTVVVA